MQTIGEKTGRFPREAGFDSTLALLREGYAFISNRCERHCSEAFRTRLMLRPVVCARGMDAAAMFYQPGRFTRRGAIPPTAAALLQDFGSVHQLDGDEHLHRKALFLKLLSGGATARLTRIMLEEWATRSEQWLSQDRVVLHPEVEEILCRAVCRWAGVPLPDADAERRTREFSAMIEGAGAFGPRLLRGARLRHGSERWMREVVSKLRSGELDGDGGPAETISLFRGPDGQLLEEKIAAMEIINLLRPTVAVARWVTFGALALHQHPGWGDRIRSQEPRALLNFVHEVRRHYPFFPMVGGRVLSAFEWRGHRFQTGDWVLLDLYGTNHDPRLWENPERFDPARFDAWQGSEFDFIAQGGGDVSEGHRCPGENPSIALVMAAVNELASRLQYRVPEQDLEYRLDRFPSIPQSRFVITEVRRRETRRVQQAPHPVEDPVRA